jgi:hypothetical protein
MSKKHHEDEDFFQKNTTQDMALDFIKVLDKYKKSIGESEAFLRCSLNALPFVFVAIVDAVLVDETLEVEIPNLLEQLKEQFDKVSKKFLQFKKDKKNNE